MKAAGIGFRRRRHWICVYGPWFGARRQCRGLAGRAACGNVRKASGAERRHGSSKGKALKGRTP